MPNIYHGFWKMISNDNFEEYLKALDVNIAVRKIATLVNADKDIIQDGDHFIIKTFSMFRCYTMEFVVGQEFEEDLKGIDDRKCMMQNPPQEEPSRESTEVMKPPSPGRETGWSARRKARSRAGAGLTGSMETNSMWF